MKRILVIEDQPDMRENLVMILEMENYSVSHAEDGRGGLDLAQKEIPDLVLCDVMLPDLNGHEVLRTLRTDPKTARIPFIFLTGKGERKDQRAGMNLGADDYLIKPVTASDLLASVAARLTRGQLRQPAEFKPNVGSPEPLE